jgi:hypothetical protein
MRQRSDESGEQRCTSLPTSRTTPTPSFPGTAGSGGLMGYFPSMVLISDGLMGACGLACTLYSGSCKLGKLKLGNQEHFMKRQQQGCVRTARNSTSA